LRTITFYSYKGGTGRTLAVANTAKFLARFNYRVFVLDLDLEAPGLHYKLGLRTRDNEKSLKGVVDFVESFKATHTVPELEPYVYDVTGLPSGFTGSIHLIPAGNAPSPEYSRQILDIRFSELFNPIKAESEEQATSAIPIAVPLFLELKARIEHRYAPDYLLIDSRTGVTEIGGIAVGLMPDTVVCLLHSNPENLDGARKVLRTVKSASSAGGGAPIEIVPILVRLPEMRRDEEKPVLDDIQKYLNEPSERPQETLSLPEILTLHSDPDLQVVEALRIGASTTANESILLRDYFKLFRKLRLDNDLPPKVRSVLAGLAEADRNTNIRPLLVGARRLRGEGSVTPVKMKERLAARKSSALNIVLPDYLKGETYRDFIERVLERLRRSLSLSDLTVIPPEEMRWDLLAVHLREGVLDFCADVYYLTENRGHLVEIVQLGWCRTFKVYLRTDSLSQRRLTDLPANDFVQSLLSLYKEMPGICVGVLGETPAASEANRRLSPFLKPTQLISKGSESDLFEWLEVPTGEEDERIVVCDHVVAEKLDALASAGSNNYSSRNFEFGQAVAVGIVYPKEDREWRKEIAKAIAYSLVDFLEKKQWDAVDGRSGSVAEDFAEGGISALSLKDLRLSLLLDLTLEEAVEWDLLNGPLT
jgi:MinD-like ATPase involved in chromosome partitioning or flagellar assembly